MATKSTRKELEEAWDAQEEQLRRAKALRKDVARTSSESARIAQTLNHLAGRTAGDAADASIRHRENMKESMAEDLEEDVRRKRAKK